MNKTRNYILEASYGEWWIQDGQAVGADGDVSDFNHEWYAREAAISELYDYIKEEYTESIEDIKEDFGEILAAKHPQTFDPDRYDKYPVAFLKEFLPKHYHIQNRDRLFDVLQTVFTSADAREFALEHLGWQRVKGNAIETWKLTSNDIKNIDYGLSDTGNFEDEDDPLFDIEVRSTRTLYKKVPYSIIDKHNPSSLNPYRSKY